MEKYKVLASIVLEVETEDKDKVIEFAADQVRECKADDFEYDILEVTGEQMPEG